MKTARILFWSTTTLIFLFEGVMPALTSHTKMAQDGITHLGYPIYFGTLLMVFKVLGSLVLILPQAPARIKEWAYAGFGIDFICASVSLMVVDGISGMAFFPLIVFAILIVSYVNYHRLEKLKKSNSLR